jgi:hypothetical protein
MEHQALKKCKQLFKYEHVLLLTGDQSYNLYSNLVHFFNPRVN